MISSAQVAPVLYDSAADPLAEGVFDDILAFLALDPKSQNQAITSSTTGPVNNFAQPESSLSHSAVPDTAPAPSASADSSHSASFDKTQFCALHSVHPDYVAPGPVPTQIESQPQPDSALARPEVQLDQSSDQPTEFTAEDYATVLATIAALDFEQTSTPPVAHVKTPSLESTEVEMPNNMSDFAYVVPNASMQNGQSNESKPYSISPSQHTGIGNTFPFSHFSHNSSFSSSGSGSAAGGSFSSVDAHLPAISRNFAPPTSSETRRPATAGGALHPSRGYTNNGNQNIIQESQEEESETQDNTASNAARRASESQLPWSMHDNTSLGMSSYGQQTQIQQQMARAAYQQSRPQTSDGLPHHAMSPALPSIGPTINHVDSSVFYRPTSDMAMSTFPGNQAYSLGSIRPSYLNVNANANANAGTSNQQGNDPQQNFVSMTGAIHKKRPRRTFDQIERLYECGWNGCEKSYGTLNHLNAHVATQKHGNKRLPSEFKDMRKTHRKKKKEHAAAAANAQYAQHAQQLGQHPGQYGMPWSRDSISSSSSSDERRDSTASYSTADYSGRSSVYSSYGMAMGDSRPSTGGSMTSSAGVPGQMPPSGYAIPQWGYGGDFVNGRRPSAPTHIPMPPNAVENGFRQIEGDYPTPTPQNPFPQMNANGMRQQFQSTLSGPMANPQQLNAPFEQQQFAFQR